MDQKQFETLMNERLANLATELRDRDQIANQLRLQVDQRIDSHFTQLQTEILRELRTGVENHRTHISSLYQKFERSIWAALVVFGAVFAFFGITQWTYIPNKINDAIETPLNEEKRRLKTKVEEMIAEKKAQIDISIASLSAKVQSVSDAEENLEQLAINATAAIEVWRDSVETEARRATRAAQLMVDAISATYSQDLTRLLIEDGLLFLEGRSVTDANVLQLLNLREDFQDQDHLRFLQAIETERLASATEGAIRAYLEQFEEQVPTLKEQFEDEFKVRLGLRFEVQSVVKSLVDDLQSENREQILKAFEILNVPEVACAGSRRFRRSGPSFVDFREQLIKLLTDSKSDATVRDRSFFALLELRRLTPLEIFAVGEYIKNLNTVADLKALTNAVECFPADEALLKSLLQKVEAAQASHPVPVSELALATANYIMRYSGELDLSSEVLERALPVLESGAGTLAKANAAVEAIQSLVVELQREGQFTESPHFVNITEEELRERDIRSGYDPDEAFSECPEEFVECPVRITWLEVDQDFDTLKLTGTISSKTQTAKFEMITRVEDLGDSIFLVHEGRIAIEDGIWLGARLSDEEDSAIKLFLRFEAPNS